MSILPESSVMLCFFVDKRTQCKEMFPVYGGKSFSCKAFHSWVERFPQ
jgi:hypothetical protein